MSIIGDKLNPIRASFVERPRRQGKTAAAALAEEIANTEEAFTLLGLISAEFQSDPSSVACFDLLVVARVKACVEKRKIAIERGDGLGMSPGTTGDKTR